MTDAALSEAMRLAAQLVRREHAPDDAAMVETPLTVLMGDAGMMMRRLIDEVEQLRAELAAGRQLNRGLADRVQAQSDLLSRHAERVTP